MKSTSARPASSTHAPSASPSGAPGRRWVPSKSLLITAALLAGVLFLQWPMLKGMYYRAVGGAAPAATIPWRSGFDAALAEAQESDKPLMLVFSASWCPPCNVMKHEVWPDADVGRVIGDGYLPVHIDVDDPRAVDVVSRYQVRSIPAVLVVDDQGQVLRQAAFMSPAETLTFLSADVH